jgi:hypothetical protein
MVQRWLDAVATELGIETLDNEEALLDTARVVAHSVERKATPLTTFLIGVAAGRGADAGDLCDRVSAMAMGWRGDTDDADGSSG